MGTLHRYRADTERGVDRRTFLKSAVAGATLVLAPEALRNRLTLAQASPENLEGVLEPIRRTHRVPALAGALVRGRELVALGAVGVRQARGTERVQTTDRFQWVKYQICLSTRSPTPQRSLYYLRVASARVS